MANKINLSYELQRILKGYSDEIMEVVCEEIDKVAEEAAKELHHAGGFKGTGKYKKSWSAETERQRTFASAIVHNKKHYRLTHLLEYGHAKADGGRTKAFPHIASVNENAQKRAIKRICKAIEDIK